MASEPTGGLRGFFRTAPGKVAFLLLVIGATFGTFTYVSTVLAIPILMVMGIGFPVYLGLRRPRFLALSALVVLIAVAPLSTLVFSDELLIPPAAVSSPGAGPYETGGSVLQNATISPFSGASGTNFTWNVTVYPRFLQASLNGTNWSNDSLKLFVSTCPGATSPNASYCGGGFTLITLSQRFSSHAGPANGTVFTFHRPIASNGIWSWQIELVIQNTSNASTPYLISLSGDPAYNGIEGPIVGGFATAYGALIGTVYEIELIYLGLPFYFILLLYVWFKQREARRKQMIRRAAQSMAAASPAPGGGPSTPAASGPGGGPPAPPAATPATSELACPSCGAVIYANETKCWKCGAGLGSPAGGTPLPTGGPPPPVA
jgi:hypothetical protein